MWLAAGIEISFHRIGLAAWVSEGVLRSWAEAPWQATPTGVAVACLPTEALWLGLTNTDDPATLALIEDDGNITKAGRLQVPPAWQLGSLRPAAAPPHPITLGPAPSRSFRLDVQRPESAGCASLDLVLMSPAAWGTRFGPIDLAPAESPPPMQPYSRIVRPRGRR